MTKKVNIPVEMIGSCIYLIRGRKVMRDTELAKLYGVETFNLNKAVRRNRHRFPEDFMFQITHEEAEALTFQIGMSKSLNSERAIKVNIAIMRAFVRLREMAETHKDLAARIDELQKKYGDHDVMIREVFEKTS